MMFEDNLVEVIKDGQIMRMSRAQAEEEDLFVLNRPGLKQADSPTSRETIDLRPAKHNPEKSMKEKVAACLIENFHWKILRARREKSMSRKQLAGLVGEKEEVIKRVEYGDVPMGSLVIVDKIEQALGIKLRKESSEDFNSVRKMIEEEARQRELKKREEAKKHEEVSTATLLGEDIEILD